MSKSNERKAKQLGMPHGTAANKLRKSIMFALIKQAELDTCFRCNENIEDIDNLSIEHKVPWLNSEDPVGLYFDLDNIAFSHTKCNYSYGARRDTPPHGTYARYKSSSSPCKCDRCREANRLYMHEYDKRNGITNHHKK